MTQNAWIANNYTGKQWTKLLKGFVLDITIFKSYKVEKVLSIYWRTNDRAIKVVYWIEDKRNECHVSSEEKLERLLYLTAMFAAK